MYRFKTTNHCFAIVAGILPDLFDNIYVNSERTGIGSSLIVCLRLS